MSKVIATATAFLISLIAFSQVSENRTVADFSKLKAATSIQVSYTVSETKSVKVETDDQEKLQFIKTEVENGTLKVFVDAGEGKYKGSNKGNRVNGIRFKTLKVTISGPSLTAFKASSSADIEIENLNTSDDLEIAASSSGSVSGKFKANAVSVDVSSSADFKGSLDAKTVTVEVSSSGDAIINGKTDGLQVKVSSSGTCNAKELVAETVEVKASSSADATVFASKSIDAKASSSADISYYGNPSQVIADKSSSGSVNKR
jgi:anti-sigma28 factor (negative regulator of flagellin synthesis)